MRPLSLRAAAAVAAVAGVLLGGLATTAAAMPVAAGSPAAALPPSLAPTTGGAVAEPAVIPPVAAAGPSRLAIVGHWFRAGTADDGAARGAIVLLHGCGGAYRAPRHDASVDTPRRLDTRLDEVVDLARAAGWHALVVDSLGPRGERELCTQRIGARRVTQRDRRLDAVAALAWLAAQPGVDAGRLGLVGWSHGGSTVLAAVDGMQAAVATAPARAAFAVAHYPGCGEAAAGRWQPVAPVLLLVAGDDDWTPPEPCRSLASDGTVAGSERDRPVVTVVTYPGAVHGFDGRTPGRRRTDVPNGRVPGAGVSSGRQDAAAVDARARLDTLLRSR